MSIYIIEPRDTALFRDARPFVGNAGATTMPVPWPSTVTGLMRNRASLNREGHWAGDPIEVLNMRVAGPWLVELNADGSVKEHYFPAPQDAVFYEPQTSTSSNINQARVERRRLRPDPLENTGDFVSDMPTNDQKKALLPLMLHKTKDEALPKSAPGPTWWKESALQAWLTDPSDIETLQQDDIGITLPAPEERIHVGIDNDTRTAKKGALFTTRMQRFTVIGHDDSIRRFAIAAWADPEYKNTTDSGGTPRSGSVVLGGERRASTLSATKDLRKDRLNVALNNTKVLRIMLLTPGIFEAGWHPSAQQFAEGRLIAARTQRPTPVSGWDLQARGPKPTRLMVPKGAMYWIRFDTPEQAQKWATEHHFTTISDREQDRKDGFGLIAVGRGDV